MIYRILEVTETTDTIITSVEYDIEGHIITVDVPHFQPENDDAILLGITNRYTTEMYKIFPERMPPAPEPEIIEEPIPEEDDL